MKIAVLAGAVGAAPALSNAHATVRIRADSGGQIGPYLENLVALRSSGERVIIDGPCLSACTMLLGVIPHSRICVTPRARLGFHAAWHPASNGQQVTSREATQASLRVARGCTGRKRIVKFEGCFQGATDALLVRAGSGVETLGEGLVQLTYQRAAS